MRKFISLVLLLLLSISLAACTVGGGTTGGKGNTYTSGAVTLKDPDGSFKGCDFTATEDASAIGKYHKENGKKYTVSSAYVLSFSKDGEEFSFPSGKSFEITVALANDPNGEALAILDLSSATPRVIESELKDGMLVFSIESPTHVGVATVRVESDNDGDGTVELPKVEF